MAPIDLKKNQSEILKIHKEVSDPKSSTNWALFGYEGKSNTLEVVSKGDGGIEEFIQELNSGRIYYGYLKVIDPNSNLPKFVFVNWQGEGVPEIVKGSCVSHVRDVSSLLKGVHISINARNEDDIDEETIMSKVSKSSGANYSFHKEQKKDIQPIEPVGSVYQKIKPQIELKPVIREKFWEDAAKDEQNRKESEKKRIAADREQVDKEIKERELQDTRKREEKENDRLKMAREIKAANQLADAPSKQDKSAWGREQEDAKKDQADRAKRSDQLRNDRTEEAQKLIASSTSHARSVFMQKPASQFDHKTKEALPTGKLKTTFHDNEGKAPLPQVAVCPPKLKLPEPRISHEEDIYDDTNLAQTNPDDNEENLYDDGSTFKCETQSSVEETNEDVYDDTSFQQAESNNSKVAIVQGIPKRVESDDEDTGEALYDDVTTFKVEGTCAIALYDYQAAEENEITFDPGDTITEIDMIDDGWWIGTDKDGRRGMFPSNYVELIDS